MKDLAIAALAILSAVALEAMVPGGGSVKAAVLRLCSLGLFAVSLNLLVGYTGLLSFGHATFFGLGAYGFTMLLQSGQFGVPAAFAATIAVALLTSLPVGLVCIRLNHVYFAFLTLSIQMLFHSLLIAWSGFTGGEQGLIGGIPVPVFLGVDLKDPTHSYLANIAVFVLSLLILHRIVRSPFGAALRMIRDNTQRAVALGIDVPRVKLTAFVVASLFSAVAGMLMALYVSGAYPNFAYWTMSGEGLFMIMLGGTGSFLGPAVGAFLLIILETLVNMHTSHHGLVLGLAILATALGLRRGVLDFALDHWKRPGWKAPRWNKPKTRATKNAGAADGTDSHSLKSEGRA